MLQKTRTSHEQNHALAPYVMVYCGYVLTQICMNLNQREYVLTNPDHVCKEPYCLECFQGPLL